VEQFEKDRWLGDPAYGLGSRKLRRCSTHEI
jgi:hypothetical protein